VKSREYYLDSLRGIAALLVVNVHFFQVFFPYSIFGEKGEYQKFYAWEELFFIPPFGIVVAGHFAVCIFFILSGYVLSYNYLGVHSHFSKLVGAIIKRPIRLGGLVLFSILLSALLWHLNLFANNEVAVISSSSPWFTSFWQGEVEGLPLLKTVMLSMFSEGDFYNPPLWTIKIELYGSIMVYLFLICSRNYHLYIRLFIIISFIALFINSIYVGFWLGIFFADIKKHCDISKFKHLYIYVILGLAFIFFVSIPHYVNSTFINQTVFYFLPSDVHSGGGYSMLAAVTLFMLVLLNDYIKEKLNHKHIHSLGAYSFGIYIFHLIIISSFSSWLFLYIFPIFGHLYSFIIVYFVSIPVIIYAGYLTTKYIDSPAIKLAAIVGNLITLYLANIKNLNLLNKRN
jgi:peptidoglycan/LPS O-acetylase OafA/YrhL